MFRAHTDRRCRRGVRLGLLLPAAAVFAMAGAHQAVADPSANGIEHSNGAAQVADPSLDTPAWGQRVDPPAWGKPAGDGTGRKIH